MKKVKYNAAYEANIPTLGIFVKPGDEIEVDDDFENVLFILVEDDPAEVTASPKAPKTKGDNE